MKAKPESKVITCIGGFYMLGGAVVLLSLLFGGSPLASVFDLPAEWDSTVKLILGITYIPLGYCYLRRIKYAQWVVMALAIIFFCVSASLAVRLHTQPYIGNTVYTLFVIIMTYIHRGEFTLGHPTR